MGQGKAELIITVALSSLVIRSDTQVKQKEKSETRSSEKN